MFIDNLELTLGEFCDLIQADDEADAGVPLAEQVHRSAACDAWAPAGGRSAKAPTRPG